MSSITAKNKGFDRGIMNLKELIIGIDAQVESLLVRDPFWRKCYPCKNHGRCCQNDSPLAASDEFAALDAFLLNNPDIRQIVFQNLQSAKNCIFYAPEASACLVHEMRPAICRLTPFKTYVSNKETPPAEATVFDSAGNAECHWFLKKQLSVLDIDGLYVRTAQNSYFMVNDLFTEGGFLRNARRIDDMFLRKYPEITQALL